MPLPDAQSIEALRICGKLPYPLIASTSSIALLRMI
jgi:hypothetical protein